MSDRTFETVVLAMLREIKSAVDRIEQKRAGRPSTKTLSDIAISFIRTYEDKLTECRLDERLWTIAQTVGECVGRVQKEGEFNYRYAPGWALIVLPNLFVAHALQNGIAEPRIKQLLKNENIKTRRLKFVKNGRAKKGFVIPMVQGVYTPRGPETEK
jgi:hypothetical protein